MADLVTEESEEVGSVHVAPCEGIELEVTGLEDLVGVGRESDKTEKLQRILFIRVLWVFNLASVFGSGGGSVITGGVCISRAMVCQLSMTGLGLAEAQLEHAQAHASR